MTMTLIETKTLASAAASIEFTSIPQTFTDLVLLFSGRASSSDVYTTIVANINNDGTLNRHFFRQLYGTGSSVASDNGSLFGGLAGGIPAANATANTFGNLSIYYPNYTGSTQKSYSVDVVTEHNATSAFQGLIAGNYNQTTAITSLALYVYNTSNFVTGTTASLYGITKGSDGIVTTS